MPPALRLLADARAVLDAEIAAGRITLSDVVNNLRRKRAADDIERERVRIARIRFARARRTDASMFGPEEG